jgi:hypothetical protein
MAAAAHDKKPQYPAHIVGKTAPVYHDKLIGIQGGKFFINVSHSHSFCDLTVFGPSHQAVLKIIPVKDDLCDSGSPDQCQEWDQTPVDLKLFL